MSTSEYYFQPISIEIYGFTVFYMYKIYSLNLDVKTVAAALVCSLNIRYYIYFIGFR